MERSDEWYLLPSHPSVLSLDPLGLCDDDDPTAWTVFVASIISFRQKTAFNSILQLPQLIEDLSYSIHMKGHLNTRYLRSFLSQKFPDPRSPAALSILNQVIDAALLLPEMFPTHMIPYLNMQHPLLRLSTQQIKSLLAHQILNTLTQPSGNTSGSTFSCWYSDPQPLENAVSGYLSSLFDYFTLPLDDSTQITYQYFTTAMNILESDKELEYWMASKVADVFGHLTIDPASRKSVPFPHDTIQCTLVASNKSPGFGASCTQKELVTGACPPLLPLGALFISPPVPFDAALISYGCVPLFHWKGQGRDAQNFGTPNVGDHTFLFLDASELDTSHSATLADLHPEYLLRDLHQVSRKSPWGAGAFGGDPIVKSLILGMAAAREGITVYLSVDEDRLYTTWERMTHLFEEVPTVIQILQYVKESYGGKTVDDIFRLLQPEYHVAT